jgi:hypothetical protein
MAFARFFWPSEAAVARIFDATGRKFTQKVNIEKLRSDLHRCRWQILGKQVDSAAYRKSHKKAAAEVTKQALKLDGLLRSSGNRVVDMQLWAALDQDEHDEARALLKRIAAEAKKIAEDGYGDMLAALGETQRASGTKDRPTKPHLVDLLKPIYEAHLNRPAGRSHDDGGPFPRFVCAVSKEMGRSIRVSRHTVHKALTSGV